MTTQSHKMQWVEQVESSDFLEKVERGAETYCASHGLVVGTESLQYEHVPCTLVPVCVPESQFTRVQNLSILFNLLCDRIARHPTYLTQHLAKVAESDEFTGRLFSLYSKVKETNTQSTVLGVLRSDYMLHPASSDASMYQFKQVELNTIASAFAHLSQGISQLHHFTTQRYLSDSFKGILPENQAAHKLVQGMAVAYDCHEMPKSPTKVLLMVVQPNEKNSIDQIGLEMQLWQHYSIPVVRASLDEIQQRGSLSSDGHLLLDTNVIAVVYFRAGYTPRDYPTEYEWKARQVIEMSSAIKCPSIAYQLVGTKKIQQSLCEAGTVELFLTAQESALIRETFAEQWSLDRGEIGQEQWKRLEQRVKMNREKYVMKPQREGGGNNYFGDEMVEKLETSSEEELKAYVLMERLYPPSNPTVIMRKAKSTLVQESVSEFGIYGVIVSDGKQVRINQMCGHLVRTKPLGVDEGGVASGYAVLDSPLFCN